MERQFLGVWIPKEIYLNKELTPTEKLLLAEIASFSVNGTCFASNEHFSEFLGISKKHVSKLITKLARMGLVSVELIYKNGTKEVDKRILNPIRFNEHTPTHLRVDPILTDEHTPTHTSVDPHLTNAYYKEHIKEQDKEQIKDIKKTNKKVEIRSVELEEEFEHLWSMYPRKEGKATAKKAYIKARKAKETYENVENGLKRFIEYIQIQGTEVQFIPHGSTWFNQQKWQDEYIVVGFNKKPKSIFEYVQNKYRGDSFEPARNRKIINGNSQDFFEFEN